MTRLLAALPLLLVLLPAPAGAGQAPPSATPSPTAPPSSAAPSPSASSTCPPRPHAQYAEGTVVLDRGSSGRTVSVREGAHVVVDLACQEEPRVEVPRSDSDALVLQSGSTEAQGRTAHATYRAVRGGRAVLRAHFFPSCRFDPTPCPGAPTPWEVTVDVVAVRCGQTAVSVHPRRVVAGDPVQVSAAPVDPSRSATYTVQGYRRLGSRTVPLEPSGGPTRVVGGDRPAHAGWVLRPTTNSRVWVDATTTCADGRTLRREGRTASVLVTVAPRLTLHARRVGRHDYVLSGQAVGRPGQQVALHQLTAEGRHVLLATTRSTADGRWSVRRSFARSGRLDLVVRTAADASSAAGRSPVRATVVH